jgi:hypothetical protein
MARAAAQLGSLKENPPVRAFGEEQYELSGRRDGRSGIGIEADRYLEEL